jgi:hypothetical protein
MLPHRSFWVTTAMGGGLEVVWALTFDVILHHDPGEAGVHLVLDFLVDQGNVLWLQGAVMGSACDHCFDGVPLPVGAAI